MKYSLFFLGFIILTFSMSNYFDSSNYKDLLSTSAVMEEEVLKEIEYIKSLKEGVEGYELRNKPFVIRDGFNIRKGSDEVFNPVRGGVINIHLPAEPKTLIPWLDNSAYTSLIASYLFNSLLTEDPETFRKKPSLAKGYTMEDIVWLKGRLDAGKVDIFKESGEGDNNYIIGNIEKIEYNKDREIERIYMGISDNKGGRRRELIDRVSLRYKTDKEDKTYRRAFDRQVVFTFDLRRDVEWHDGVAFTAADVMFSLGVIKNPYIPELSHLRLYYKDLRYWEQEGKYRVKLYFESAYFKALDLAGGFLVLPKHIYLSSSIDYSEKEFARYFAEHPVNRTPIGTGAYYFPSSLSGSSENGWSQKEYVNLVRNDNYFASKGYLSNIYFRFIPSRDTAFIELKNGRVDFIPSLTSEQFFKSSVSSGFKDKFVKAFYYTGGFSYIGYNMKKVYFRDRRVRKAITLLLDRQKVVDNFLYGLGKIVSGSQYYFGPAYNHSILPYTYDRDGAISLLNEAGWFDTDGDGIRDKGGIPFVVELLYPQGSSSATSINPTLYEELSSVGISLKLTRLEWASFLEHLRDRRFDMCILGWGTGIESDPYQIWHSSQWSNKGSNHVGFANEEADKIIESARRILDDVRRRKLYFRFHEILHEEQPYLFLFTTPNKAVYNSRYRNVKFYKGRPGFDLSQWYVPMFLQTLDERQREERQGDLGSK